MIDEKWNDNFFSKRKHIAWRAKPVVIQVIQQFNPQSVIDVGCGIGEFLDEFQKRGIDIIGIEGTESVYPHLMISQDKIMIFDITGAPICIPEKYDLATCFMVIGRLPKDKWKNAARFLTKLSDTIITVVEDQEAWRTIMAQFNFIEDIEAGAIFRESLRPLLDKTAVRSFQCTQIFRKEVKHDATAS